MCILVVRSLRPHIQFIVAVKSCSFYKYAKPFLASSTGYIWINQIIFSSFEFLLWRQYSCCYNILIISLITAKWLGTIAKRCVTMLLSLMPRIFPQIFAILLVYYVVEVDDSCLQCDGFISATPSCTTYLVKICRDLKDCLIQRNSKLLVAWNITHVLDAVDSFSQEKLTEIVCQPLKNATINGDKKLMRGLSSLYSLSWMSDT